MFLKDWYKDYKEIKKEHEYFARECYRKEERLREQNKTIKELKDEHDKEIKRLLKNIEEQEKLITELKKLIPVKRGRGRPRKEVKND